MHAEPKSERGLCIHDLHLEFVQRVERLPLHLGEGGLLARFKRASPENRYGTVGLGEKEFSCKKRQGECSQEHR